MVELWKAGIKEMGLPHFFSGSGCVLKIRPQAPERAVLCLSCDRLRQTCFGMAGLGKGVALGVPFFLHPLITRHVLMTHGGAFWQQRGFTEAGAERATSWKSKGGLAPAFYEL